MHRIFAAIGIAVLASACGYLPQGPSMAAYHPGSSQDPECLQATPGESVAGFRCTGHFTDDGSAERGR